MQLFGFWTHPLIIYCIKHTKIKFIQVRLEWIENIKNNNIKGHVYPKRYKLDEK